MLILPLAFTQEEYFITSRNISRSTFSIMQIIQTIQEEYPDIRFHFFSSNADAIIERLDKGLLDMGFLLEPEISPRYDYQKLQLHETWGILMRNSPLAASAYCTEREPHQMPVYS